MASCENCGKSLVSPLACESCGSIFLPAEDVDYFEALGIKREYSLCKDEIEDRQRKLGMLLHPDFAMKKTPFEQRIAQRSSALVNDAATTLKDDLERAKYLLSLYDDEVLQASKETFGGFLAEMLDRREELGELRFSAAEAKPAGHEKSKEFQLALEKMETWATSEAQRIRIELESLFEKLHLNPSSAELKDLIARQIRSWSYIESFNHEIMATRRTIG
ncbi:MAG: Fe-S protein assembly co-chaperone HscB [Planctomycetes bacterium]|nr:Fe-S protein assembly co-chaperone HscB [Planctomycetota bacterium]